MNNDRSINLNPDESLLGIVRELLSIEGFGIRDVEAPGSSLRILVAENRFFAAVVAALHTVESLLAAEDHALRFVTNSIRDRGQTPKRWDAYLVLLTQQDSDDNSSSTRDLYSMSYDTHTARRVIHAGVEPTPESVRRALAPFVKPPSVSEQDISRDPLDLLSEELGSSDESIDLIRTAITAHRNGKEVSDVL